MGETWARPRPGTRLGRYVLTEQLGEGAMGVVYAARDETLGRSVALKLITPRRTQSRQAQLRFEQEARMLAAVEHPAVVEIYDVGRHAGRSYLVMPKFPGQSLRDWLATPRPREEILAMFDVVAAGLTAAHQAGVLHCDFKPDNVLLDAGGRPKVADFGLARLELPETNGDEDSARAGRGSGTPAYLAPELHQGAAPSVSSDVYAYHVALFEALMGARPFKGGLLRAKLEGIGRSDVSKLPRRLRLRLLAGLDPDASARPRALVPLTAPRGRVWMWAVPVVAGLLLSGGVAASERPALSTSCAERADAVVDEASHWSGRPKNVAARATVERVHGELEHWRAQWRDAFVGACSAGDHPQADCLAKVRIAGESWMRPPSRGDSELDRAMLWSERVGLLPEHRACTGADDTTDPGRVAELAEIRFSLNRGHIREGVAQALALSARATRRGDAKTRFAAQILAAEGLGNLNEFEQAQALLGDVIAAAESTGQWQFATEACIQLIWAVGVGETDLEQARALAKRAEAYADRTDDDVRLRVSAQAMLSGALERRGELSEAAGVIENALALVQENPDAPRMEHIVGVLVANRVSLAAKRNDLGLVLDSADAIAQLEREEGEFSGSVLTARSALAHAQGLAGQFDASIDGFDTVADRYAQMGDDMVFWVHQSAVNAAQMELRAERPQAAQARLEVACPAMASLRDSTHTNVLLCSLSLLRAQALSGAPVELDAALEIVGTIEARYDDTRLPTQEARVAAAEIAMTLQETDRVAELVAARITIPSLEAEMAWLRARAELDPARAVAKYEAVCSVASPTLRPDLCLRALEQLETRSLTIDVQARKRAFLAR